MKAALTTLSIDERVLVQRGRSVIPDADLAALHGATTKALNQAANVLRRERAVQMGLTVVRAFVWLRQVLASHKARTEKREELGARVGGRDRTLSDLIAAIWAMIDASQPAHGRNTGFHRGNL